MKHAKPWYASKTIWGSLVAMIAGIAGAFGHGIDPDLQTSLVDGLLKVIAAAGSLMAIYGRVSAVSRID